MAWLSGWNKRIAITIDSGDVDADLSHFPVLLYLSASSGITDADVTAIFDEVGANKLKIAITKADGTTQLYVEVEDWDEENEEAWLWVSRDGWTIDSETDTTIYIYYDSTHADNSSYVGVVASTPGQSVWDSNYIFVQHLSETSGQHKDSTGNALNSSTISLEEQGTSQYIDGGDSFEPDPDYLNFGDPDELDITPKLTLECLMKPEVKQGVITGILGKWDPPMNWRCYTLYLTSSNNMCFASSDDGSWTVGHRSQVADPSAITEGAWHYYVGVFNSGSPKLYRNASDVSSSVQNETTTIFQGTSEMLVGCHEDTGTGNYYRPFDGQIDEVRISDAARSAQWIKATWQTMKDHFVTFGTDEEAPVVEKKKVIGRPKIRRDLKRPFEFLLPIYGSILTPFSDGMSVEGSPAFGYECSVPMGGSLLTKFLVTREVRGEKSLDLLLELVLEDE